MGLSFSREPYRRPKPTTSSAKMSNPTTHANPAQKSLRSWKGRQPILSFCCKGVPLPTACPVGDKDRELHIAQTSLAQLPAELPTEANEKELDMFQKSPGNPTRDSKSYIVQLRLDCDSGPPTVAYDRKPSLTKRSTTPYRASSASLTTQDTQFSIDASSVSTRATEDVRPPSLPPRPNPLATFRLSLASAGSFEQFDWNLGHATKERAAKLHEYLISTSTRFTWFTDSHILDAARITEEEKKNSASAWNLICADHGSIRCRDISVAFCEYLLHLVETATQGIRTPCQTPVGIRVKYDRQTNSAQDRLVKIRQGQATFTQCFLRMHDELDQAHTFVAFLELTLKVKGGSVQDTLSRVHELVQAQTRFEGFRLVEIEELSNLLATLIRNFRQREFGKSGTNPSAAFELFRLVVNSGERKTPHLFHSIVTKLEGLEVPLCLGFFLNSEECLLYADEERYISNVKELFRCLEAHYATVFSTSHANSRRSMPFWSVVELLRTDYSSDRPFLVSLHRCMELVDEDLWKSAWCDFGWEEEYNFQRLLIRERLAGQNALAEAVQYMNDSD